jgi:hypothetical protein
MGLINAVTRHRLELAQGRNCFLDAVVSLCRSRRYLSDEALKIDKSKLDDVGHVHGLGHTFQIVIDTLTSQKFILRNRLTPTSTSHTKTGERPLCACALSFDDKLNLISLGSSERLRTPAQSFISIVIDPVWL